MSELPLVLRVFAFACLPAAGTMIGALLAEVKPPPRWIIGAALHGAAGIAVALICFDLMPSALERAPLWVILPGFAVGALASLGLAQGLVMWQENGGGSTRHHRAYMVYTAVGADLLGDGLMTGIGSAADLELGLLLASAQLFANVPGGFAAGANIKKAQKGTGRRLLMAAFFTLPTFLSAIAGYLFLRGASPLVQGAALAFVIGLLLLATIEDMVPEGDAPRPPRWSSTIAFAAGFIALASVSTGSM